jgi:hypothetical protein
MRRPRAHRFSGAVMPLRQCHADNAARLVNALEKHALHYRIFATSSNF